MRGELVAEEAEHPGRRERPWMGEVFGVDQASDGLVEGDGGGDEDGEDGSKAGQRSARSP